jgi:hypothetical protein
MIRGIFALTAVTVALMAALPAVAKADLITQRGAGTLRASGSGVSYGVVGKGTIWVLDRTADGHQGWSVSGWSKKIHHAGNWWELRGSHMSLQTQRTWSMRIYGSGIQVRIVANGTAYLQGSGRYAIGRTWHNWPAVGHSFPI